MVVDTSILVAILLMEPGCDEYVYKLAEEDECYLSSASLLEASIVMTQKRGPQSVVELDRLLVELRIRVASVTESQSRIGREAFIRYGKGRHRAKLNLGDCFAYALAVSRDEALLFKGADFSQTDVRIA